MIAAASRPDVIGCYYVDGQASFYPARYDELERQAVGLSRVIRSFAFEPGSMILTVSIVQEVVQFAGFEKAVQILGLYGTNAESSPFDAGRVEALGRQFNPVAVCGVGMATIRGLKDMGHDPATVFAGRTVWARPDAWDVVRALPDVDARRVVLVGPVLALECARGNIHYDTRDWTIEARDGRLHLSSRMPRVTPLADLDTGIAGSVVSAPCPCGTKESCIALETAA